MLTDGALCELLYDGPLGAKLLGLKLPAFHQHVSRKRVPDAAIVRIGSAVLYRRAELIRYRDQLRANARPTTARKAKVPIVGVVYVCPLCRTELPKDRCAWTRTATLARRRSRT